MQARQKGILFAILSSSMSISPVLFRLTLDSVNPEMTNLLQTLFASLLFLLLFVALRKSIGFRTLLRHWKGPVLIAFFVFIGGLLFTYGIWFSGPTTASFVIQFTTVFTILAGVAFLKERFTRIEALGIVLAAVGLLAISYTSVQIQLFSLALLLLGAASFAMSNLLSKIYVKNVDPVALAGGRSMFICLFFLVYSLLTGKFMLAVPAPSLLYTFLAAVTGVFLNFILFFKSLQLVEISVSSAITAIGPLFTALYSFLILALIPTLTELLGGIIIITGIALLSLRKETLRESTANAPGEPRTLRSQLLIFVTGTPLNEGGSCE